MTNGHYKIIKKTWEGGESKLQRHASYKNHTQNANKKYITYDETNQKDYNIFLFSINWLIKSTPIPIIVNEMNKVIDNVK